MILIHPFAQRLRNGMPNAKDYPWWRELIALLDRDDLVQIGVAGEEVAGLVRDVRFGLPLKEVSQLLLRCEYWIAVDSFLPHLAHNVGVSGVCLWSVSDPNIFGYPEHLNVLKDRSYLRAQQFAIWEEQTFNAEAFVEPREVMRRIEDWIAFRQPRLSAVSA